ncbi:MULTISPECIES: hypothetical protein [Cytobacillus]|uniref:hypothetical protein n=1 Tax=Cytobacillus TaxID=2675230 RepID=UPI00203DFE08|nr:MULTISPECIES: hypothetical protein [Cytobacillus]MCM3394854.1 hypothetical protein [Cytobacillus oceanisediminis]UQX56067.1 hypothetical protein M5V91_10800 [Cytobacillus pseudoceanisediminis]
MEANQICFTILKDSGRYKVNKKRYKFKRQTKFDFIEVLPEEYWDKPFDEQHVISYSNSNVFSTREEAEEKCYELNNNH